MARKKPLPCAVLTQAVHGNAESMGKVLTHYKGYIRWLAKREFMDRDGIKKNYVDQSVFCDLEAHLIEKILAFDLDRGT